MSLKFGIYLVEQRIISPEQFCGLVKIQQETTMSLANIALRKNVMTIKQVAQVLDEMETSPDKTFEQVSVEMDFLDQADMTQLIRHQQMSCTPIRKLVSECGLLTERQSAVLFNHFEKMPAAPPMESQPTTEMEPTQEMSPTQPTMPTQPTPSMPQTPGVMPSQPAQSQPRVPKFKSRPVIMRPYSTT